MDKELKKSLAAIYAKFDRIALIKVHSRDFDGVKLHSNNFFYDFLLKICRIVHDEILITENRGIYEFKSFTEDPKKMAFVFERFVKNFYRREQKRFTIDSPIIKWNVDPESEGGIKLLPIMKTDMTLTSADRRIVIDTKFYIKALTTQYEKDKIRADHIYQMFAYLKNLAHSGGVNTHCEGILLYPTVKEDLCESYGLSPHKLAIQTVNLDQPWQNIHDKLLSLLD